MIRPTAVLTCLLLAACASAPAERAPRDSAPAETTAPSPDPDPARAPERDSAAADSGEGGDRAAFADWRADFRARARAEGIAEPVLATALASARYLPAVIERDRAQPELTRQVWEYLDIAVSPSRVSRGREQREAHAGAIEAAAQRYGVDPTVLVAVWGLESSYGSNFGDTPTIDALATLAFEGRRRTFAERELLAALRIIGDGDIAPDAMRGSWAGAMGHTQFLPTSFRAYAVDADGDGRRDIWHSIPDVMASTAHYLSRAGWRQGQPWGAEVVLPADFDYALAGSGNGRPANAWAALGVRAADGGALPELPAATVLVPAGARGPAFLVGGNFDAILRYNNATSYALAIGLLARRIDGGDGLAAEWPRALEALTRDQVTEMQRLLNARGFDAGAADGLLGPNTRSALRAFQTAQGLVPDGFPTVALLARLRHSQQDR
ncbi:lytic murein transglycosylase [Algiphilus sp.]|uniref:lytic murein transglycosylase n=1 Tax=Algiphilus sp. TaxID=1872431 RepID=UPI0025B92FA8|nr:lytic murein transglycosylase [Algiphilus sp.]MCK5769918.1 lytic murein transglycosylase [Algiphilus sp.]